MAKKLGGPLLEVKNLKKYFAIKKGMFAKPALLKSAQAAGADFRKETRKQSVAAILQMQKFGLKIHAAPPEAVAEWEKKARIAWPALMGKSYPPPLVLQIETFRDQFRAQNNPGR